MLPYTAKGALMLCDDLDESGGGGGAPEGGDICIHIADSLVVQQKLIQHCVNTILNKIKMTSWYKKQSKQTNKKGEEIVLVSV